MTDPQEIHKITTCFVRLEYPFQKEICYMEDFLDQAGHLSNQFHKALDLPEDDDQNSNTDREEQHEEESGKFKSFNDTTDDLERRMKLFGQLDQLSKISKKIGGPKKQAQAKDINYYDQGDPFIDDDENPKNKDTMTMVYAEYSDFQFFAGSPEQYFNSDLFKQRVKMMSNIGKQANEEAKKKSEVVSSPKKPQQIQTVKEKQKQKEAQSQRVSKSKQQQSLKIKEKDKNVNKEKDKQKDKEKEKEKKENKQKKKEKKEKEKQKEKEKEKEKDKNKEPQVQIVKVKSHIKQVAKRPYPKQTLQVNHAGQELPKKKSKKQKPQDCKQPPSQISEIKQIIKKQKKSQSVLQPSHPMMQHQYPIPYMNSPFPYYNIHDGGYYQANTPQKNYKLPNYPIDQKMLMMISEGYAGGQPPYIGIMPNKISKIAGQNQSQGHNSSQSGSQPVIMNQLLPKEKQIIQIDENEQ